MNVDLECDKKINLLTFCISFAIAIISYHLIYSGFFPNINAGLGHDYSYFLPYLLNGFYWFKENGLFEVPWFTPAFCGGIPFLPNPQSMYYSVPQFLTIFTDPLASVYLTFIIFAAVGFIGFYQLSTDIFRMKPIVAAYGATLFMFNGFYTYRMLIGHLTYHAFMLIPLIACLLLQHSPDGKKNRRQVVMNVVMAGIFIAYFIHSGASNFIVPALICVLGIWMLHGIQDKLHAKFCKHLVIACVIAFCLSATKLFSAMSFISNFPRDMYPLPGIYGFQEALLFMFETIFMQSAGEVAASIPINYPFILNQHEFEFSVTIVPLLVLPVYLIHILRCPILSGKAYRQRCYWHKLFKIIIFGCILLLPVVLNTYTPTWNAFLKTLPYIKNSSSLIRWIAIDIPLVILIASVALNSIKYRNIKYITVAASVIIIIILNITIDRSYYHEQLYKPNGIINAYYDARHKGRPPEIKYIGAFVDENNVFAMSILGGNDLMIYGVSQLACYEAIFGYRLERFPDSKIYPGNVLNEREGILNIRNPVCYIFGKDNNCIPGDHFKSEAKEEATAFTSYRPFSFRMPFWQSVANWINCLSLIVAISYLLIYTFRKTCNFSM